MNFAKATLSQLMHIMRFEECELEHKRQARKEMIDRARRAI